MINTIFYFVDTENEYQNKYRAGDIKPYTIALARDTKSIWKDGIRYGGLNQLEVDTIVNGSEDEINTLIDQINNTIDEINDKVSEEKDRLDGVIRDLDGTISDKVSDMISDSQFIQQNFPQGVVTWQNGWNDEIQAYLKSVGLWDYELDGSIVTKWSAIRQSINNITSEVNSISDGIDGHVNSLLSQITQEVNDRNEAITTISNTYASSVGDINGIKEVIEWMYSGLTSSASEDLSFTEIKNAGKNGMNSAISDLRTEVESIGDTYVAKSSLTSAVNDAISGVLNETEEGQAMSTMFSKIDANSDDLAAIATKITGDTSQASVSAKLNGMTASLVTTANVDLAIAGLSAQGKNNVAATIFAQANNDGSTITLNADQINFEGQSNFDTAVGTRIDAKISNANVITQSNLLGEVEAILEGGNATFNGDVVANTFTAGNTSSEGLNIYTTGNQIQFRQGSDTRAYFISDGSGLLLYIKDENGDWHCIDFNNWQIAGSANYTPYIVYTNNGSNADMSAVTIYKNETDGLYYYQPKASANKVGLTYYELVTTPLESDLFIYGLTLDTNAEFKTLSEIQNVQQYRKVTFTGGNKTYANVYVTRGLFPQSLTTDPNLLPGIAVTNVIYNTNYQFILPGINIETPVYYKDENTSDIASYGYSQPLNYVKPTNSISSAETSTSVLKYVDWSTTPPTNA